MVARARLRAGISERCCSGRARMGARGTSTRASKPLRRGICMNSIGLTRAVAPKAARGMSGRALMQLGLGTWLCCSGCILMAACGIGGCVRTRPSGATMLCCTGLAPMAVQRTSLTRTADCDSGAQPAPSRTSPFRWSRARARWPSPGASGPTAEDVESQWSAHCDWASALLPSRKLPATPSSARRYRAAMRMPRGCSDGRRDRRPARRGGWPVPTYVADGPARLVRAAGTP
jgi:hypothetical protein